MMLQAESGGEMRAGTKEESRMWKIMVWLLTRNYGELAVPQGRGRTHQLYWVRVPDFHYGTIMSLKLQTKAKRKLLQAK